MKLSLKIKVDEI